jgi:hypothetical protein
VPEAMAQFGLRVVDARRLERPVRDALRPGGLLCDRQGRARQLPRYFYEIPSWEAARETRVAPHFHLWEFIHTDVREAPPLRTFPRYVPCAVTLLAACLEQFRGAVGTYVHIAANGGYRSPRHRLTCHASPHAWGTAVNIYRIGDTFLDTQDAIERYAETARAAVPGLWARPYGHGAELADDHLHLDLGYVVAEPRDVPGGGDTFNPKLDGEPW